MTPEPNWTVLGDEARQWLGRRLDGGDFDGDGFGDLVIGGPGHFDGYEGMGTAVVFFGSSEGLSRCPAWRVGGDEARARFGMWVASAGDMDGDGDDEFMVSAPQSGDDVGSTLLFAGGPQGLEPVPSVVVSGEIEGEQLGFWLAAAGDVDGDGLAEAAIGVLGAVVPEIGQIGRVEILRGTAELSTVGVAWQIEELQPGEGLRMPAGGSDLDGDGRDDLLIGAPEYSGDFLLNGRLLAFPGSAAGPLPAPIAVAQGTAPGANLGVAAIVGDIDGDGVEDVFAGEPETGEFSEEGTAYLLSGAQHADPWPAAWSRRGEVELGHFGGRGAGAGDLNSDGYADLLVGAPGYNSLDSPFGGAAYLFLGAPGFDLGDPAWEYVEAAAGSNAGFAVEGLGDVNGDGFDDVAVGEYGWSPSLQSEEEGRVLVFYGCPDLDGDGERDCDPDLLEPVEAVLDCALLPPGDDDDAGDDDSAEQLADDDSGGDDDSAGTPGDDDSAGFGGGCACGGGGCAASTRTVPLDRPVAPLGLLLAPVLAAVAALRRRRDDSTRTSSAVKWRRRGVRGRCGGRAAPSRAGQRGRRRR